MESLPHFFREIPDPRRSQGRRHSLTTVLAIAAGAVLCGMRGYRAIGDCAQSLGPKARERFRCRRENGRFVVPSEFVIRDLLIRINPQDLSQQAIALFSMEALIHTDHLVLFIQAEAQQFVDQPD